MKTTVTIAGAVLLGLCMAGIAAAESEVVAVIGKAEFKAKPDVAYVTLFVKGTGTTMVDAAKEADQKLGEVKDALQKKHKKIARSTFLMRPSARLSARSIPPTRRTRGRIPRSFAVCASRRIPTRNDCIRSSTRRSRRVLCCKWLRRFDMPATIGRSWPMVCSNRRRSRRWPACRRWRTPRRKRNRSPLAKKQIGDVVKIGGEGQTLTLSISYQIMGREPGFPTPYYSQDSNEVVVSCTISVTFEMKKQDKQETSK